MYVWLKFFDIFAVPFSIRMILLWVGQFRIVCITYIHYLKNSMICPFVSIFVDFRTALRCLVDLYNKLFIALSLNSYILNFYIALPHFVVIKQPHQQCVMEDHSCHNQHTCSSCVLSPGCHWNRSSLICIPVSSMSIEEQQVICMFSMKNLVTYYVL